MSLTDWDKSIAPCLQSIERNATWIEHYARDIQQYAANLEYAIKQLPLRPEWETKARDQLRQSAETLSLTLALCRSAMEAYDAKPLMVERTTEAAE